jgi:TIR domain
MRKLRKPGIYFLLLLLLAFLVFIPIRFLARQSGNPFSTIGNCLPDSVPCVITPTLSDPPPGTVGPTTIDSSSSVEEQLEKIDQVLSQSVQSSIAYNVPEAVMLDDTVSIELLLNPSVTPTQLAGQITENGEVVTALIEITPMMRAELIPQTEAALTVRPVHAEAVQVVSNLNTTRWAWLVTGKESGAQKLSLVIYRLIKFEGQDYWREVKSYQAEINVEVTFVQRLQSLGWAGAAGSLIAILLLAVLWRGFERSRKPREQAATSRRKGRSGSIFISYRRSDSADITGRIYDRLVDEYGRVSIFKDVDSIPLGTDFKEYLDRTVSECNFLLAIIGDHWLDASNDVGKRRLDDPQDFVRVEIESALEKDIPVIPLLVRGARMPEAENLPASLRSMVYKNGISIRPDPDFHRDMDRLISALDESLRGRELA